MYPKAHNSSENLERKKALQKIEVESQTNNRLDVRPKR
jgi:hypothetical protein